MVIHHPDGTLTVDHENYAGRVFKDQAELTAAIIDDLNVFTQAQADRLASDMAYTRRAKLPDNTTLSEGAPL